MVDNNSFPLLKLERELQPNNANNSLQAWDAADQLLLNHFFSAMSDNTPPKRILVINDSFGAICGHLLKQANVTLVNWSDSYCSQQVCQHNLAINELVNITGYSNSAVEYLASTEQPTGAFDAILIKVPKTLALLEHQLICLQHCIDQQSLIIGTAMVKYLRKSQLELFAKYIGATTTSLAKKKARLIFSQRKVAVNLSVSPYPQKYPVAELGVCLENHANVFSREQLDIGARFFLQQFGQLPASASIVDLGCGNGILGLIAKRMQPAAHLHFIDESYMAISSAKANLQQLISEHIDISTAQFHVSDCLSNTSIKNVELILCNPPFHQNNTIGDHIAMMMFKQASEALAEDGQLWVVANRHLNYQLKLKRWFKHCKIVATNKKFMVLAASL
ncbi:MAG: 16S rRNA (guanine1207-N2)-methyltransferase [Oceanicoccus sp.]|jgi:16S rRNA (guanine1207-N2)-methyltransferase